MKSDITATLQELRITGGADGNAGGLQNSGTTTRTNCTVIKNVAGNGGGIHNDLGSLTLLGCAVGENESAFDGGRIYNTVGGTVTLDDTTVTLNRANFFGDGGSGGGIFNAADGTVKLQNGSSVTGNTPDNCAPPDSVPGCNG